MLQSLVGPFTGKWKAEIVFNLRDKPLRLSELEQRIPGANPRVLKRQLRSLENERIIQRKI
jgi:DNA-binding HxlR family transcriptional regulator